MSLSLISVVELGSAWAGNSVNCVPFRANAIARRAGETFVSYYDGDGRVVVCAVAGDSLRSTTIVAEFLPFDAHQCISMAFDPKGRLHLAFGAHNSPLFVCRTRTDAIKDGFTEPTCDQTDATYPTFINLPGEGLIRLYRRGTASNGAIWCDRLDASHAAWQPDEVALLDGSGTPVSAGPYLNTPVVSADGTIFLFLVWRLPVNSVFEDRVVNVGLDLLTSRDGLRTLEAAGGPVPKPVSPLTSQRIFAVPAGRSLVNQSSAALLSTGTPAAVTYWEDDDGRLQYQLCWQAGSSWRASQLSNFTTRFQLRGGGTLPVPHSRPELLVDSDGTILVIFRSSEFHNRLVLREFRPPDYLLAECTEQILVDEDLGFYEPILDRHAWSRSREIVMYVQSCGQTSGEEGSPDQKRASAIARLMTWKRAAGSQPDRQRSLWSRLRRQR
jgi:hypothetical protein